MGDGIVDLGGEVGVHQDVDLHGGVAEDGRAHELGNVEEAGVIEVERGAEDEAFADQAGHLGKQLQRAAAHDTPRHAFDGRNAYLRAEHPADQETAHQ